MIDYNKIKSMNVGDSVLLLDGVVFIIAGQFDDSILIYSQDTREMFFIFDYPKGRNHGTLVKLTDDDGNDFIWEGE